MPEQRTLIFESRRDALGLGVFLIVCIVVSGIGGVITATSVGTWYQALEGVLFNPPDWVFAVQLVLNRA